MELVCKAQQVYIEVEYDLFKTLIQNLVDNAVKAGAKHIRITGQAMPDKAESNQAESDKGAGLCYQIRVQDDGSGIPKEEVKRITEAFYMVDKSRSRKQHGAGLGLSLAEKIAQIHGSRLVFQSDGHSGTTVYIDLKCREGGVV